MIISRSTMRGRRPTAMSLLWHGAITERRESRNKGRPYIFAPIITEMLCRPMTDRRIAVTLPTRFLMRCPLTDILEHAPYSRTHLPGQTAKQVNADPLPAIRAMADADPCRLTAIRIFRRGMIRSACSDASHLPSSTTFVSGRSPPSACSVCQRPSAS